MRTHNRVARNREDRAAGCQSGDVFAVDNRGQGVERVVFTKYLITVEARL